MRVATLWLLLSCVVSGSALASTWSDLWATPEQQAQHLLNSRQAAAAAPLFSDPRRRGYAELRAGQYAQAAKSLAPLHDADSLYNRGNALAHTGQLRDALAAYDAALKQSPGGSDIVHNHDLVERALQKQQQQNASNQQGGGSGKQQQGAGGQPPGHDHGKQQAQANSQAGKPSGNSAQAGTPQSASAAQSGSASPQQQGATSPQHPDATSPQQQGATSPQQQTAASQQPGGQSGADSNQDSAAFADGERSAHGTSKATVPPSNAAMREARSAGEAKPPPPPRSEQSLALDQWLRGIPDDSGELLRRKFLIEHMMRQQRNPQ